MKIKFLMIGLLGLVSATAFAQRDLKNANESYTNFLVENTQKILAAKAATDLADAKASIDKAATNDKSATLPQTYALKGAIYSSLALRDTIPATAGPLMSTAQDAIKSAITADTKGENKKIIADANLNVAQYYQTMGVKQFQEKKYDLAYQSFDRWNQALPDTLAEYYTALSAGNAGITDSKFYPLAITHYNKLLTSNFSQNPKVYNFLTSMYLFTKDTVNALKTINAAVVKYPSNTTLREMQITTALQSGKAKELVGTIDSAIKLDQSNKNLYYYKGLIYSQFGDTESDKATKSKDATTKVTLRKQALADYASAAEAYKKAVEIDPKYFDACLNLGNTMMKPAIDTYNEAANLPSNSSQKQYDDMRAMADVQFDAAKPYLQKAVDLNPKSSNALINLRNYYRGKYDKAHAAENKAKADDLKKQIDALPAGS
jgi:tetratricopeptide (TPR) repeat protein